MRRLPLCFFLIAFSAPLAFADGTTATISRVIPSTGSNSSANHTSTTRGATNTVSRGASASRTTSVQSVVQTQNATPVSDATTDTRDTSARSVVNRATTTPTADKSDVVRVGSRVLDLGGTSTTSSSRGSGTTIRNTSGTSRAGISQTGTGSARENLTATVNTVGRNARVEAASVNNNPAVRRAGLTLRPSTAEVGGRATIAGTDIQTGSNIDEQVRGVQSRAATTVPTAESIAEATERMNLTSDLNTSCQQQYNDCMDQFCNVIDSNQGRCSCSANLSDYVDVEEAVTDANNQLNEVAQRIRYVGLSADEIRAIMEETEAEEALSGAKDTSETRNMLEEIEELIRDPVSSTSYASSSTSFGLDMDLDFSSNTADIFNLDFLNTNTTSFSNLRGTSLYNAAKNRCKTILDSCEAAGANVDQITANYDLAVDKDCIAYEAGLKKMNETLVSNVRSANLMLQKARLAVMQNKNQYDAKGCIAALDACMTDDMVCGADYTKCLDPTKRYIDENGDVVLGENITDIIDFMKNYNNSWIDSDFLSNSYSMSIGSKCKDIADSADEVGNNGACIVKYLLQKIGTKQEVTDEGLCRAVLDKCQAYTYDDRGNYLPYNDVVVNYVQRAMVNIQAEQRQIISDYASNCMLDIANCYNQQVTQVNAWTTSASVNSIYNVMRGACRNVALTCAYAVFDNDTTSCPADDADACIENISQMFYQSMMCPDNASFVSDKSENRIVVDGVTYLLSYLPISNGCQSTSSLTGNTGEYKYCMVSDRCYCNIGYEVVNGQCLANCPDHATRGTYGSCTCTNGYEMQNGVCVCPTGKTEQDDKCVAASS